MKHGPIALIDQFMPVVVIAPKSDPNCELRGSPTRGEACQLGGAPPCARARAAAFHAA